MEHASSQRIFHVVIFALITIASSENSITNQNACLGLALWQHNLLFLSHFFRFTEVYFQLQFIFHQFTRCVLSPQCCLLNFFFFFVTILKTVSNLKDRLKHFGDWQYCECNCYLCSVWDLTHPSCQTLIRCIFNRSFNCIGFHKQTRKQLLQAAPYEPRWKTKINRK